MEQATQQSIQKPSLPNKTKIAIWYTLVCDVITLIIIMVFSTQPRPGKIWEWLAFLFIPSTILSGGTYSLYLSIFFSRKFNWYSNIIWQSFIIVFSTIGSIMERNIYFFLFIIPKLIPFVLLLLDRKNFFRFASQAPFLF